MLFDGVKLLFSNWRLTIVQVLPAMWIWLAMLDLKIHVLHSKSFIVRHGLLAALLVAAITAVTAAAVALNAVFAFAIAGPGDPPEIRPAFARARSHRGTVLVLALSSACCSACPRSSSRGGGSGGSRSRWAS
jgi:hypothetical protein